METQLSVVIGALLLSAFFSGSEIAFVSTNRLRIEIKGKRSGLISNLLATYVRRPSHFITSMLIGNNIAMVIYGVFFPALLVSLMSSNDAGWVQWISDSGFATFIVQTVVASIIVLVVAEFIPKALCSLSPFKVLNFLAIPLAVFYYPFLILVEFTVWLAKVILRTVFRVELEDDDDGYDRVDLFHMVDETSPVSEQGDGEVNTEIFKNALEFAHTKIRECMVPRPEIDALDISEDIEVLKDRFFETGRSKLVVYKEHIDNILGYVHSIDLFNNPKTIKSMIIPMPFASESTPASEMLRELIDKHRSMAHVIDEFGGTAGIVTVEDLIEEIFGEIDDEYDVTGLVEIENGPNDYVFSARHEIEYLNDRYKLEIPEGDYDTLGGYFIHHHQSIPEEGEVVEVAQFKLSVLGVEGAKIENLRLQIAETLE